MKLIEVREEFDRAVAGSFFLHEAETTKAHRDEACSELFPGHRTIVSDEGMRLNPSPHGEGTLKRLMCRSWHEGCWMHGVIIVAVWQGGTA